MDTGYMRPDLACSYLLEADGEAAFIETGTNNSVPGLLAVLDRRGWQPEQVRYVIVTHVHLDHAGGAGGLMERLPRATLLVHPRGARHMIDPSRLEAGVRAVYGDEVFAAQFGGITPVPEARCRIMQDGDTAELGGRTLSFIDTPGHARHHFCVWDDQTRGWFTGDTFGISYRDTDTAAGPFIFPTTTPVDFDPPELRASIRRLLEWQPEYMYLTHYGRVGKVANLAETLLQGVDAQVEIAERHDGDPDRTERIRSDFRDWLFAAVRRHGVTLPDTELERLLGGDVDLNTQGMEVWLERRKRA